MTANKQCLWCGNPVTGKQKYCKPSHRQRAYEKRRFEQQIIEAKAEGGKVALRIMGE